MGRHYEFDVEIDGRGGSGESGTVKTVFERYGGV